MNPPRSSDSRDTIARARLDMLLKLYWKKHGFLLSFCCVRHSTRVFLFFFFCGLPENCFFVKNAPLEVLKASLASVATQVGTTARFLVL